MKKAMRKFAASMVAVMAAVAMVMTAIPAEAAAKAPKKITLSTGVKTIDIKGKTTITVKSVSPKGASTAVSYKSSSKKIATVSSKGVVTGKKAGKVKITVTSKKNKKVKKTVTIKVKDLKPTSIAANDVALNVGAAQALNATVKPAGVYCPLTYKSSDASVATVSKDGKVTAVKAGTATITITSKEKNSKKKYVTKTVKVTVANAVEAVTTQQVFVSPEWVNEVINGKVADYKDAFVSEVSYGLTANSAAYNGGHIPGAFHINSDAVEYDDWDLDGKDDMGLYGDTDVTTEMNFNIRSDAQIAEFLKDNNITQDTKVVLYGARAEDSAVTRVAFAMLYAGVKDVKVMDGGMEAWEKAQLPTETEVNKQKAGGADYNFGATVPVNKNYIMSIEDVQKKLKEDKNFKLVSIRSKDEFDGKITGYDYIRNAGEPAGAIWGRDTDKSKNAAGEWVHGAYATEDGKVVGMDKLNEYLKESGASTDNELSFYCGTGWRATIPFLIAYQNGKKDISVYDAGWWLWQAKAFGLDGKEDHTDEYPVDRAGLIFDNDLVTEDEDGHPLTSIGATAKANALFVSGKADTLVTDGITYASSKEAVAKIQDGKVVTAGYGEAIITATDADGRTASYKVEVKDRNDEYKANWATASYKVEMKDLTAETIKDYIIFDTRISDGSTKAYDSVRFKDSLGAKIVAAELYPMNKYEAEKKVRDLVAENAFAGSKKILVVCMGGGSGASRAMSVLKEAGIEESRLTYLAKGGNAMYDALQANSPLVKKADVVEAKINSGKVTGNIDMTKYEAGKKVRVWLPIPQGTEENEVFSNQDITDVSFSAEGNAKVEQKTDDKGNKVLYIEWGADAVPAERTASYSFHVKRTEVLRPELKEEGTVDTEKFAKYLGSSKMVKIDDPTVKALAEEITAGKTTVLDKTKAIYEWIYRNMNRDESVRGCGDGDIVRLLQEKKGKCTDINSVFVGLCRASGVPAREKFGIRINAANITTNQHCWAEFYLPGTGWVGADVADVLKFVLNKGGEPYDKDSEAALAKYDYFWGNADELRVQLAQGRDITLDPAQNGGENATLNTFNYPYGEVEGSDGQVTVLDSYAPADFNYTFSFAKDN